MEKTKGKMDVVVPKWVKSGKYNVRVEIIGLHSLHRAETNLLMDPEGTAVFSTKKSSKTHKSTTTRRAATTTTIGKTSATPTHGKIIQIIRIVKVIKVKS
ncbi:hypothetical protein HDV00_012151 [Rhizophlyctis rosea]|nr:hypothetical protein HDV00_012151 [Rhizophlyctis rosea]